MSQQHPDDDATAGELERALEATQRQERSEREADLARQAEIDERISRTLAERDEK